MQACRERFGSGGWWSVQLVRGLGHSIARGRLKVLHWASGRPVSARSEAEVSVAGLVYPQRKLAGANVAVCGFIVTAEPSAAGPMFRPRVCARASNGLRGRWARRRRLITLLSLMQRGCWLPRAWAGRWRGVLSRTAWWRTPMATLEISCV